MTRFLLSSSAVKQVDAVGVGCFLFERFEDGLHVLVKVGHGLSLQVPFCGCTPRQTLEAHLALTLVGYAVIEAQRSELKLSFYKLRRGLASGRVEAPMIVLDDGVLTA